MNRHWLIIDTHFLAWRSFFSVGHREALPSILLTIAEVDRLSDRLGSTDVAFAFDRKPYHRSVYYPPYKQTRTVAKADEDDDRARTEMRCEIDKLYTKYLEEVGWGNAYSRLGFEADDVVAALVAGVGDDNATIVSSDQDLYQLLSPRVTMFNPMKDTRYTAEEFKFEYGIHPVEWAEAKAIAGCSTDGVPGARGIGMKTACQFIAGESVSKARRKLIEEWIASDEYKRNMTLTTLPYPGLTRIEPVTIGQRPPNAFHELCKRLDMEGIENGVDRTWRRRECGYG
jgi:5'-3' exonuclease